jgi:hypothetical protein
VAFICEVKSLTDKNETGQIRLAIGQLLDYVHTLNTLREAGSLPPRWEGVHAVRGVVAARQGRSLDEPVREALHHPHLARGVRRHAPPHGSGWLGCAVRSGRVALSRRIPGDLGLFDLRRGAHRRPSPRDY